jgi:hypothetical protein
LVLALLSLFGLAPGVATATPKRGQVGGPPTDKSLSTLATGNQTATGPLLVIASGPSVVGPIELVAQEIRRSGLCVATSYLKLRETNVPYCGIYPPFEGTIAAFSWGWARRWGDVAGTTTQDVATVTVKLERNGNATTVPALLAKPEPLVWRNLGTKPFTYFYATYRGCAPPHKIVAQAHDAAGTVIGRSRGFKPPKGFGNPCVGGRKGKGRAGASGVAETDPNRYAATFGSGPMLSIRR